MNTRHLARCAVMGAIAFATTQYLLFALSADSTGDGPGWFLNTGTSLIIMIGVLATACAIGTVATPQLNVWQGSGAFALGAIVAMSVTLFTIGPGGNLFPIVIVFGGFVITAAALSGGSAAFALRSLFGRRFP
jgi:hypothetical protein